VADALRIPWVAVRYSHRVLESKWDDWLSAFEQQVVFHDMPAVLQARLPVKEYLKRRLRSPWVKMPGAPARWQRMPYRQSTAEELTVAARWLGALADTATPQLTTAAALQRVEEKLLGKLQQLREDYAAGRLVAPARH